MSDNPKESFWERIETPAKVLSLVAIPTVIAILGWIGQETLAARNLNRDYVRLAVSVLTEKDPKKLTPGLRAWAVDMLNANSPVPIPKDVIAELKAGEALLPAPPPPGPPPASLPSQLGVESYPFGAAGPDSPDAGVAKPENFRYLPKIIPEPKRGR